MRLGEPGEGDVFFIPGQEARKDRIGIEVGETPPHDAGVAVDQRRGAAIADQRQVEILRAGVALRDHTSSPDAAKSANPSRASPGSTNTPFARGLLRPTK